MTCQLAQVCRKSCQRSLGRPARAERRLDLIKLRAEVAALMNEQLEAHGFDTRVTHLSYADRGIPVEPERWIAYGRDPRLKQNILDARRARYAVVAACEELSEATVAMEAEVHDE